MSPAFDTVLWDLDGTIADTVPLIRDSLRHAVRHVLGHAPDEQVLMSNIFLPLEAQMAAFDPDRVDELCAAYLEWNHAVSRERLTEHEGMVRVVRDLHHAGVPQGIASSKSRRGVDLALEILDIRDVFGALVTSDDVEAHKPDPEPLVSALRQLGQPASGACYVGDALTDMRAAVAAGVVPIAVAWGSFDGPALTEAGARHVADDVTQLRAVLGMPA